MIWRSSELEEADRTANHLCPGHGAPQSDRNLIVFSLNAGLNFHEPILHRDDDTFGIGMGYARVSGAELALDKATTFYTGAFQPVRSGETYLEVTYQYQLTPAVQLQPDFQYVFNPGGGIVNPDSPSQTIKNEAVLGFRVNLLL